MHSLNINAIFHLIGRSSDKIIYSNVLCVEFVMKYEILEIHPIEELNNFDVWFGI